MRILKWFAISMGVVVVLIVGGVVLLTSEARARLDRTWTIKVKDVPIPFPLSADELARLDPPPGADLEALAMKRAIERGRRYVESRAACSECHGKDFGGGVIVDNPVMGRWIAPNITRGGVTKHYTNRDWVRIVRHGVKPDGHPATMPSEDFTNFSDQEISDIAAYIQSLPPVDREMPPTEMGPMFAFLVLKGDMAYSADQIDHDAPRPVYPPALTTSLELGEHLAGICRGCHGPMLSGGPIRGGDPAWPPAANLTFDKSGLSGWTLSDFQKALKEGVKPDGTKLDPVMPVPYTARLEPAEVESLYRYLKTLPARPMGS